MGYNDDGAKAPAAVMLPVVWTLFGVAALFFVARIVIRIKFSNRIFIDDGLAFAAVLLLLAHAVLITYMLPSLYLTLSMEKYAQSASHVNGKRAMKVYDSIVLFLKLQFAQTLIYWTCIWTVKASFLAFFKRLTNNLKGHIIMWWVIVVITFLAYAGSVISYPISCSAFSPMGCSKPRNVRLSLVSLRFSTAVDVITDLLIIALPMSLALRVRLPLQTRLALVGVFSLGGFIIVFCIIRIIFTNTANEQPEISWLDLWSAIEASIAVIVCNLAPFKILFQGRARNYTSDPYHFGQRYAEAKHPYSHELSSSSHSRSAGTARQPSVRSEYPPHPAIFPPARIDSIGRPSNSRPRKVSRRGPQTKVSADHGIPEYDPRVQNGGIVVTKEFDSKESAAEESILTVTDREDEKMRTMWTDRVSSDSLEEILTGMPVNKKSLADVYERRDNIGRAR